ncbi:MAG: transposase [Deltaproteobacteria bacterium]|nr:transposase [Deltaproteobacteria bacterium]
MNEDPRESKGWYSRGYLPHRDHPGLVQAITYRLADSLPTELLSRFESELRLVPPRERDAEPRRRLDSWLDQGHGSCALRDPRAAKCIVENWRRFTPDRYDLIAWVVMPNHVHGLIRILAGTSLGKIVQSWKSYTGRRIRELLSGTESASGPSHAIGSPGRDNPANRTTAGGVWMREYWDRYIRDDQHFDATVNYIHQNPVKAGLVRIAEDWPWSSAAEYLARRMGE